jgi:ketosteroid isomerase-like protein
LAAQALVVLIVTASIPELPDMRTEENNAVALSFFERFTASDIGGALATMTDDATWWIPGKKERSPSAGLYPKDKIGRLFHRMLNALESGLNMTVVSCIGEGDCVALEVISSGDLKNGRQYRQEYHMLLKFRDGKIASVREYLDTQHANDVWAAPLTDQELEKVR